MVNIQNKLTKKNYLFENLIVAPGQVLSKPSEQSIQSSPSEPNNQAKPAEKTDKPKVKKLTVEQGIYI